VTFPTLVSTEDSLALEPIPVLDNITTSVSMNVDNANVAMSPPEQVVEASSDNSFRLEFPVLKATPVVRSESEEFLESTGQNDVSYPSRYVIDYNFPTKMYDLMHGPGVQRSIMAPDWLKGDISTGDYVKKKREEFATRYFKPVDLGDETIIRLVDEFKDPSNYYDSGRYSGKLKFTEVGEKFGLRPSVVADYFYDLHEEKRDMSADRYHENPQLYVERRREYLDNIMQLDREKWDKIKENAYEREAYARLFIPDDVIRGRISEKYERLKNVPGFKDRKREKNKVDWQKIMSDPEMHEKNKLHRRENYRKKKLAERSGGDNVNEV
jgi:hypothetical protein